MPIEVSSQEGEFLEGIPWISNEYRNFDGLNPIIIPWNPIKSPFLLVKHKSQLFLRAKSTFSVGLSSGKDVSMKQMTQLKDQLMWLVQLEPPHFFHGKNVENIYANI